jgi:N-acetylglucosaminyldiphosphoundecaprenol N-acetyl-beta-D-mannosaminyltransferase
MKAISFQNVVDIFGFKICNISKQEIINSIEAFIRTAIPHAVFTPNVDDIVKARRDAEFASALQSADLLIPDGMGIVYGSYLLGTPFKEMIGGRRLVPELCRVAAERGWKLYLFGAKDGNAERARKHLEARFPGLKVVKAHSPSSNFSIAGQENEQVIADINRQAPEILVVGLGSPKGKKWIIKNKSRLKISVALEVGGTFDILAGARREPPAWVPNLGLEWLYRLLEQPGSVWKRYVIDDPIFFWWILKERYKKRRIGNI